MLKKTNTFILLFIGLSTITWQNPLAAMHENLTPPQAPQSSPTSPENLARTSLLAMRIFGSQKFSPSTPYPTPRLRQESPEGPDSPLFKYFKNYHGEKADSATSDEENTSDSEETQPTKDCIFAMDEDLRYTPPKKTIIPEIPMKSYLASLKRFNNPPKKD